MTRMFYSLLLLSSLALAEPGTVIRKTDLRDKPFLDAAVVGNVSSNTQVDIQSRKGAWMQVKLPSGQAGWIKLLNVRTSSGTTSSSTALANVIKTGSSGKTVTTGVKGLSAEEIQNARPNLAEVAKMSSYAANSADAQKTAQANQLIAVQVPAFANSTPTTAPGSNIYQERRR
ncbi:SH3 domain-containing protein [Chitinibacter sp. GC72]|uniref:SH3 domain-containing protein n=1 Tax=Chitinibacter sp. GC72 TaxID=1526917 RepID=UPI0012F8EAEA|nr:SH3 domain-containing protein [Chitinibacter sp. GC72]